MTPSTKFLWQLVDCLKKMGKKSIRRMPPEESVGTNCRSEKKEKPRNDKRIPAKRMAAYGAADIDSQGRRLPPRRIKILGGRSGGLLSINEVQSSSKRQVAALTLNLAVFPLKNSVNRMSSALQVSTEAETSSSETRAKRKKEKMASSRWSTCRMNRQSAVRIQRPHSTRTETGLRMRKERGESGPSRAD